MRVSDWRSKYMFCCNDCHTLAGHEQTSSSRPSVQVCAGCGKTVQYACWSLPKEFWFKLEVALALKEAADDVGQEDSAT